MNSYAVHPCCFRLIRAIRDKVVQPELPSRFNCLDADCANEAETTRIKHSQCCSILMFPLLSAESVVVS